MGLDFVELGMEVEDEFGIKFNDADYERMATVGDLQRLVLQKHADRGAQVASVTRSECQSLRTFLWLRATLRQVARPAEFRIRPSDSLSKILPNPDRRRLWEEWSRRAQLPFPELKRIPVWDALFLKAATLVGLCAFLGLLLVPLAIGRGNQTLVFTLLVSFPSLLILASFLLQFRHERLWRLLPEGIETFADLTCRLQPELTGAWSADTESRSHAILERLRKIIHEQLGIPLEDIHPDSRFIEDLGC